MGRISVDVPDELETPSRYTAARGDLSGAIEEAVRTGFPKKNRNVKKIR